MENNSYRQHEKLIEELFESDKLHSIDLLSHGNIDEAGSGSAEGLEPISSEVFVQKVNVILQSLINRYPDAAIYFSDDKNRIYDEFPELGHGLICRVNDSPSERIVEYTRDALLENHSHMSFFFPREKCLISLGWELDVCAYGESEEFNSSLASLARGQGLYVRTMDNIWTDEKRLELYFAKTD